MTTAKVKERCRKLLANFKVPHRVHFLDELPRTPTGKVRKQLIAERIRATPAPEEALTTPSLVVISVATYRWNGRGGRDHVYGHTDFERIDHDQPLFEAGLDSLGTVELIEQFEQRFRLKVSPTLLYDHPTMRELVAYFALQDTAAAVASAAEQPRATAELPSTPAPSRARRSATAPGALLLQVVALGIKPALLALKYRPCPRPVRPQRRVADHLPIAAVGTSMAGAGASDHHGGRPCVHEGGRAGQRP